MGRGREEVGRAEPLEFFSLKPCINKLRGDYFAKGKVAMVTEDITRSADKTFLVANEQKSVLCAFLCKMMWSPKKLFTEEKHSYNYIKKLSFSHCSCCS